MKGGKIFGTGSFRSRMILGAALWLWLALSAAGAEQSSRVWLSELDLTRITAG